MITLSLKEVLFKRPFYQAPVLLLSPRYDFNEGTLRTINSEYNAITSWVEVGLFKKRTVFFIPYSKSDCRPLAIKKHFKCRRKVDNTGNLEYNCKRVFDRILLPRRELKIRRAAKIFDKLGGAFGYVVKHLNV